MILSAPELLPPVRLLAPLDEDPARTTDPEAGSPADLSPADLVDRLYGELKELAERQLRDERDGHTLQPTALVHEAWLRLERWRQREGEAPARFKALAAKAMRRVLVDHARARLAERRGGGRPREELDEGAEATWVSEGPERVEVLALENALAELGKRSERQMRVIEMRFFGGLSQAETAHALGVSEETVKRDWRLARAWLHRELERGEER